jgi:hypothetical protein
MMPHLLPGGQQSGEAVNVVVASAADLLEAAVLNHRCLAEFTFDHHQRVIIQTARISDPELPPESQDLRRELGGRAHEYRRGYPGLVIVVVHVHHAHSLLKHAQRNASRQPLPKFVSVALAGLAQLGVIDAGVVEKRAAIF